ncbi:hypothetical protein VNO77_34524 [Canavalia gladiata]|uniref:Uncharacterized protein n=1 Tax=Canavalia gladiata TaxID=3824 RepID=A0AAN9KEF5_CANGL
MKIATRGSCSLAPPGCLGPLFFRLSTLFVVAETTSSTNKACAVLKPHPWEVSPPPIIHDPHTTCPDTYGVLHVRSRCNLESCCSDHVRCALTTNPLDTRSFRLEESNVLQSGEAGFAILGIPWSCFELPGSMRLPDLLDQTPQPRALSPFDSHRCYLGDLYSNRGVDTVLSAPAVEILKSYGLEFITL